MTTLFTLKNVRARGLISYPDLDITAGSINFISGKSGDGKSTLLNLLNGMLGDYTGTITYLGHDIRSYDPLELRQEVLLVSQSVYLFETTVEGNFVAFYEYRGLPRPEAASIVYYLELCSLSVPLDMLCAKLSAGEQHRVYLAIFISFRPGNLLLDEPTAALDSHNAEAMLGNICEYCRREEVTLLVVSHDVGLSEKFAENLIVLEGGHE